MIFSRWVGPHWKALYLEWHSWNAIQCYKNTASCRSVYQCFLLRNSKNSCTPMSTKLWKNCDTPAVIHRNAPNRATAHSLMRGSSQNRTEGIYLPLRQLKPQLFPTGNTFPQALLYVALLPNPAGLSVHSDEGLSRSYTPEGQSTQKVPPLTKVTPVTYTWHDPQGIRKVTNKSNTPNN